MNVPVHVCRHCRKALVGAHFTVTQIDAAGRTRGTVSVCSIICLIQWAYAYGIQRGAQGIKMVKDTFEQIASAIRGR